MLLKYNKNLQVTKQVNFSSSNQIFIKFNKKSVFKKKLNLYLYSTLFISFNTTNLLNNLTPLPFNFFYKKQNFYFKQSNPKFNVYKINSKLNDFNTFNFSFNFHQSLFHYMILFTNFNYIQSKRFIHSKKASVILTSVTKDIFLNLNPVYLSLSQNKLMRNMIKLCKTNILKRKNFYLESLFYFNNKKIQLKDYRYKRSKNLNINQFSNVGSWHDLVKKIYTFLIVRKHWIRLRYKMLKFRKFIKKYNKNIKLKKKFLQKNLSKVGLNLKKVKFTKYYVKGLLYKKTNQNFYNKLLKYNLYNCSQKSKKTAKKFFMKLKKLPVNSKRLIKNYSKRFLKLNSSGYNNFHKLQSMNSNYWLIKKNWSKNFFNINRINHHHYLLFLFWNPYFLNHTKTSIWKNLLTKNNFKANNSNTFKDLSSSNLLPHSKFVHILTKQISSLFSMNKIREDVVPLLYHTLIRFVEHITGKKFLLQFYPFLNQNVTKFYIIRYKSWIPRMGSYERRLGHKFFFEEALHVMHLSFIYRDSILFSNWLKAIILRISFWKTRSIFRFIRYLFLLYFTPTFKELGIKGLKIKLKGKISVAGNSRKRTILYRTGETSHSKIDLRVSHTQKVISTFTGVMGFQVWIFY